MTLPAWMTKEGGEQPVVAQAPPPPPGGLNGERERVLLITGAFTEAGHTDLHSAAVAKPALIFTDNVVFTAVASVASRLPVYPAAAFCDRCAVC